VKVSAQRSLGALAIAGAFALGAAPVPAATGSVPWWTNCTNVHKSYAHGVGKLHAHDHTRSGTPGVTTFKRSTRLYNSATSHNSRLDGDKDGVACEKQ
jgi:hypothetical protein